MHHIAFLPRLYQHVPACYIARIALLCVLTYARVALAPAGRYDSPEYAEIEESLTSQFTVRLVPKPDCWQACLDGQNKKIYQGMQGASEFTFGVRAHVIPCHITTYNPHPCDTMPHHLLPFL